MTKYPLVSVHLIAYNQIKFIKETLMSILEQDYPNFEIVASDDCSTDGTAEAILELADKFPGKIIPLTNGGNLGITGNCNRALRHCRGKYIAFIGGDDLFLPGKLTAQVQWLEADSRRVMCGHQVEVFYEDGSPSHLHTRFLRSGKGPEGLIRHGHPFASQSIMIRADRTPRSGFNPNLSLVSDGLFFTEVLVPDGVYGYINKVYAKYRRHSSNITNQWDKCVNDFSQYFDIIKANYPQYMRDAEIGRANILLYGRGLRLLRAGFPKKAVRIFMAGLKINPAGVKLWVRLFQSLIFQLASLGAK